MTKDRKLMTITAAGLVLGMTYSRVRNRAIAGVELQGVLVDDKLFVTAESVERFQRARSGR